MKASKWKQRNIVIKPPYIDEWRIINIGRCSVCWRSMCYALKRFINISRFAAAAMAFYLKPFTCHQGISEIMIYFAFINKCLTIVSRDFATGRLIEAGAEPRRSLNHPALLILCSIILPIAWWNIGNQAEGSNLLCFYRQRDIKSLTVTRRYKSNMIIYLPHLHF